MDGGFPLLRLLRRPRQHVVLCHISAEPRVAEPGLVAIWCSGEFLHLNSLQSNSEKAFPIVSAVTAPSLRLLESQGGSGLLRCMTQCFYVVTKAAAIRQEQLAVFADMYLGQDCSEQCVF